MSMEQTWRWYGPNDPVTLNDIRQAGAVGIVTALHEIPAGKIWPVDAIKERKNIIEWDFSYNPPHPTGLKWSVVESIPVHEDIKTGQGNVKEYIENYKQSIRNLSECGIKTVCYNFMPVVDWTRTDLSFELEDGSEALRFNATAFAAFDLFMLEREGAKNSYSKERIDLAKSFYKNLSHEDKKQLQNNIIAGLPGGHEGYTLEEFKEVLSVYDDINELQLRENLAHFLREIIPVAEKAGVKMAIHPDDPPRTLFGLPRVVSKEEDLKFLLNVIDSPANGFTMCTGSYGVRPDNDLPGMVDRYGEKMHFIHLRSTKREDQDPESFYEADHLVGDVNMYEVVKAILEEETKRRRAGRKDKKIPMRPDHGHKMLDDLRKKTNPGYSAIGRLRGLGELRGLEMGLEKSLFSNNS